MKKFILAALVSVLCCPPVVAQETDETTEEGIGEVYLREDHGDWAMRCVRTPEDQPDQCHLYQRLFSEPENALAEALFYANAPGSDPAAFVEFITPLRTLLTAGLGVSIDGGQPNRVPFTFCQATGCVARVPLNALELQAFRAGGKSTIFIVPVGANQAVTADMSLSGFTAGMGALILSKQP